MGIRGQQTLSRKNGIIFGWDDPKIVKIFCYPTCTKLCTLTYENRLDCRRWCLHFSLLHWVCINHLRSRPHSRLYPEIRPVNHPVFKWLTGEIFISIYIGQISSQNAPYSTHTVNSESYIIGIWCLAVTEKHALFSSLSYTCTQFFMSLKTVSSRIIS